MNATIGSIAGPLFVLLLFSAMPAARQNQQQSQTPASPLPRAIAPIDMTGYWLSVISEDWRWRMVTPPRGDTIGVPLNAVGQQLANGWDPAADRAGDQCKAFGAAAIMRLPTRLRLTWVDDATLRLDTDYGQQSRLLHFKRSVDVPVGERTWQGRAVAEWVSLPLPARRGGGPGPDTPGVRPGGLKVVTDNLRPQYLRMNGIPVSDQTLVTDYLDVVPGLGGNEWLVVKTIVEDPVYLTQPYVTSAHFKREGDGAKWNPTPCEIEPPLVANSSRP